VVRLWANVFNIGDKGTVSTYVKLKNTIPLIFGFDRGYWDLSTFQGTPGFIERWLLKTAKHAAVSRILGEGAGSGPLSGVFSGGDARDIGTLLDDPQQIGRRVAGALMPP